MSGNLALVVDQAGAALEAGTHGTVALVHADGRRERVGLRALGSVVLHGDVKLSTGLMQSLAAHGVALTVLPLRGRAPAASFSQMPHRHALARHRQHLAYADAAVRCDLARVVVQSKLESMAEFARRHAPASENSMYQAIEAASRATDIAGLMGVEGAATVSHFETLKTSYGRNGPFRFDGRNRQPPTDAPNALMSLSYTLVQSQAMQLALRAGLDPQIGFLHALHRNRMSLALDLIEPARAELDDWVHRLLMRDCTITPAMFSCSEQEGLRLTKEGRAAFYPAWFREGYRLALKPMRSLLARLQVALRAQATVPDIQPDS